MEAFHRLSKVTLKAVFLHNGNNHLAISLPHAVHIKVC
jgi:hypothetical protein